MAAFYGDLSRHIPSEPAHLLVPALKIRDIHTYIRTLDIIATNPFLVPDVDHGPQGLR